MTDRLKIWHVLRAPVGGLFRHVEDLAKAQAAAGHQVGVICDSVATNALTNDRLQRLAPHLVLGLEQIAMARQLSHKDVLAYRAIRRVAIRSGAGILHGHGAKGGAFARLAAASLKQQGGAPRGESCFARGDSPSGSRPPRAFYTPHGGSLHYDQKSLIGRVYLGLERRLQRNTDGIVFESAYSARIYETKVGRPICPRAIVPNGLRPDEFVDTVPQRDAADVLFVGELRDLKGVDVLIDALAALGKTRPASAPPVRALIVGDGPDAARFKAQVERLGLSGQISFPGAMPAAQVFARGRCLVVPSRAESFPYIVLEAAARALPMIATDVGGIPEIVVGSGMPLVPPADAAKLAERLAAFLADPAPFQQTAKRLQSLVAARFTVAAMSAAVLELYRAPR